MARVAVILLAAGASTRMGRQKALLPWRGTTLLEYQLQQLAAAREITQITVITGQEPDRIAEIARAYGATVAHNPAYRTGKVSSIQAGLAGLAHDADAIMLLGVDQPRTTAVLRAIVDGHARAGRVITVPVHAGRRGHPLIFARDLLPELASIREETQGVREILRRHATDVAEEEIDDADVLLDLNSPSDVREASAPRDRGT